MAVSDGGGASGAEAGYQVHIATALDEGLGGSALLSQLHERAPELSMQEMQRELLAAQATEDSALFDLIAENYRDFFRLAQSLDTSAEVRPLSLRLPHRRRSSTRLLFVRRRRRSRGRRCWRSTAR